MKPAATEKPKPKAALPERKRDDTGIYFDDSFGQGNDSTTNSKKPAATAKPATQPTDKKQDAKDKKSLDLEDEYYDLEGF